MNMFALLFVMLFRALRCGYHGYMLEHGGQLSPHLNLTIIVSMVATNLEVTNPDYHLDYGDSGGSRVERLKRTPCPLA